MKLSAFFGVVYLLTSPVLAQDGFADAPPGQLQAQGAPVAAAVLVLLAALSAPGKGAGGAGAGAIVAPATTTK